MMKWHPMMKLQKMKDMMKEKKKKKAMMKMKMKMNDFMKEMKMKEKAAMEPGQMMKKKAAMKPMKVMKMKAALQPMKVMKMKAATKLCGAPPGRQESNHSIIDHLDATLEEKKMWDWINAQIAKNRWAYERLCQVDQGFFIQALVDIYGEDH